MKYILTSGAILSLIGLGIAYASTLTINLPIVDSHYYLAAGSNADTVSIQTMITNGDRIRWWETTTSTETDLWGSNPTPPASLPSYTTLPNATYTLLESVADCTTDLETCKSSALQWIYWNDTPTSTTPTSTISTSTLSASDMVLTYLFYILDASWFLAVFFLIVAGLKYVYNTK